MKYCPNGSSLGSCVWSRAVYDHYVLVLLLAALLAALTHITFKLLSDDISIFQIMVVRCLVFIPVLVSLIHRSGGQYFGRKEIRVLLICRCGMAALSFILMNAATFLLPLVDSTFLTNSYPVFTAAISFLTRVDQPTPLSCVGVVLCVIGNALIVQPPFLFGGEEEDWDLDTILGVVTALLSQVAFGITFVLIRRLGSSATVLTQSLMQTSIMLTLCTPFLPTSFPKPFQGRPSLETLGLYTAFVFCGIAAQIFMNRGFQIGPPVGSSIVYTSSMVYPVLFGLLVLSEETSVLEVLGAGLTIISVIIVVRDRSNTAAVSVRPASDVEEPLYASEEN